MSIENDFAQASPTLIVRGTTPQEQRLQLLTELILNNGDEAFDQMLSEAYERAARVREHQAEAKAKRIAESEREKAERDTPINKLIRAINNRKAYPEALNEFSTLTSEETKRLFDDFITLAAKRGLPLDQSEIDYGLNYLNTLLIKNSGTHDTKNPKGILQKLGL